jgi:hypothetical protein
VTLFEISEVVISVTVITGQFVDIILWGNPQTKYNSDIFVIFQKNAETNSDFVKCPSGCGTEEGILVTLDNWMKKYK